MMTMFSRKPVQPAKGPFDGHRKLPYMQTFYAVTQLHDGYVQHKNENVSASERADEPVSLSRSIGMG
jgi:hypothetical protein